eukprot:772097-Pleurochrysis_carterae.AAC.1
MAKGAGEGSTRRAVRALSHAASRTRVRTCVHARGCAHALSHVAHTIMRTHPRSSACSSDQACSPPHACARALRRLSLAQRDSKAQSHKAE